MSFRSKEFSFYSVESVTLSPSLAFQRSHTQSIKYWKRWIDSSTPESRIENPLKKHRFSLLKDLYAVLLLIWQDQGGTEPLVSSAWSQRNHFTLASDAKGIFSPLGRGLWTYAVLKIVTFFFFFLKNHIMDHQKTPVWGLPYVTDMKRLRIFVVLKRGA